MGADAERWVVFLAVIVLVAGSAFDLFEFNFQAKGTQTSASSDLDVRAQVGRTYGEFLSSLNSSSIEAPLSEYANNATITWEGRAVGLVGDYTGMLAIRELYGVFLTRNAPSFRILNETHSIVAQGSTWVVSSKFDFTGNSSQFGHVQGSVQAAYSYVESTGSWKISREIWNFTSYDIQYPQG